jgi:hypothetical protein
MHTPRPHSSAHPAPHEHPPGRVLRPIPTHGGADKGHRTSEGTNATHAGRLGALAHPRRRGYHNSVQTLECQIGLIGLLCLVSPACSDRQRPTDVNDASTKAGASTIDAPASRDVRDQRDAADVALGDAPRASDATDGNGGPVARSGSFEVDACAGIDGIPEPCAWRYEFNEQRCTRENPCSKLVVFYAGGDQDCARYDGIITNFVDAGYIATCLQLFQTSNASGQEPYHEEAARVDLVLRAVVSSAMARAVWSGQALLISGVSHGATAPVIAMARTKLDEATAWRGTRTTGACFFDGVYDIAAWDAFLGTRAIGGRQCVLPVPHSRVVGRYYNTVPREHSCSNDLCACDPDHSVDMDTDSVVNVPAANYAIADWKLIECGSAGAACTVDITPAEPIRALCTNIAASPDHACTFESLPNASHVACARTNTHSCISWFDELIAQQ